MLNSVVITGASSGIGKALAEAFAEKGYNLGLVARRESVLKEVQDELEDKYKVQVEVASLDVSNTDDIYPVLSELKSRLNQIDIVIANAGISGVNKTGAGDFEKDKKIIQTNVIGAMATVDAAAKIFRQQKYGHIVGISSVSAFVGIPGSAAYSASKAALTNYLQAVGVELQKHHINVTAVHPGFVKTDIAPNMEKYPFVVEADKAAQEIVDGILKLKKSIIVPNLPWSIIRRLLPLVPGSLMEKVF
ncbi:MAG: SDR family NAD(P)-dependent oxidoreductase [Pseudomonadales bacterium]|nr:SDR family NAD(P)-dependent oxidoreductase [Pseudomonadales bacterium]